MDMETVAAVASPLLMAFQTFLFSQPLHLLCVSGEEGSRMRHFCFVAIGAELLLVTVKTALTILFGYGSMKIQPGFRVRQINTMAAGTKIAAVANTAQV